MVNRTVSFRIPDKLIKQLAARAIATNQTKTEVLIEILTQTFSPTLEGGGIEARPVEETPQLITQMAQQARMLNQILSMSPDLLFAYDRIGRVTYVNAAVARILGFQSRDLLGRTWREINLPPALAERLSSQHESVLAAGRMICDDISFPTGHNVRIYECIFSPIWNGDNRIDSIICTGRDITKRKRAEAALRESEKRYRTLFESANDAIFIIDIATRQCLNVNQKAAQWLGYTRQEMRQLSLDDIVAPSAIFSIDTLLRELQAKGGVIFEQVHLRKDGTEIPVEVSGHVIEYGDRLVFQWFVRDISERKQTEIRLG